MLSKSFESISFCKYLMKFALFVASEVVHTPRGFKMASRLVQDGRLEPIWTQHGTELAASWLKLGPCWTHFRVSSHPWANPSPSKPLPCGLWASQNPSCALQDSTYHAGWYSPACRPCLLTLLPSLHYKIHMCINTYICLVFRSNSILEWII